MNKALEAAKKLVEILEETENQNKVELSTLIPGDVFKIGEYDFIVLEQMHGKTVVISKRLMLENEVFDNNTRDYSKSSIRKLIEGDIQPMIEKEVGAANLIEQEVDLTSVDMQNEFGICNCKVRPIIFDEARKYNALLVNEDLPDWYWTCTPWSTAERGWDKSMAVVSPLGNFNDYFFNYYFGVRPVCILKSNIFVSEEE